MKYYCRVYDTGDGKLGIGWEMPRYFIFCVKPSITFLYTHFIHVLAPSPIQNLTTSFNDTHIVFSWDEPETPNGILNYSVVVEERDLLTDATRILLMDEVTERLIVVMAEAYSKYTVSVTPQTGAGTGDAEIALISTPEESMCDSNQVHVTKSWFEYQIACSCRHCR